MSSSVLIVARKDLLERMRSRRYVVLFVLTAFTLLLAFVSSTADYRARRADYVASVREGGQAFVLREPSPLSVLSRGLDEEMGKRFVVEPSLGVIRVSGQPLRSSSLFQILPPLDVEYVIRVFLSLLAGLIVFDSIAGEKRAGRLALLLTHPVPRARLYAGKWLGGHVALATVFLPAFVAGLLWAVVVGQVDLDSGGWSRTGIFLVFVALYLSLFVTFGVTVSAFTRRPETSSVVLLFAWALLVFVLPNFTAQTVRSSTPLPDAQRLEANNTQAWIGAVFDRIEARRDGSQDTSPLAERVAAQTGQLDHGYFASVERQARRHRVWSMLSPAASLVHGATVIAGTGLGDEVRLKLDVLNYRARVVDAPQKALEPLILRGADPRSGWMRDLAPPFVSLVVLNALIFLAGLWAFNRYDAR